MKVLLLSCFFLLFSLAGFASYEREEIIDENLFERTIRSKIATITHCYRQGLAVNPDLKGTVSFEMKVSPRGRLKRAKVLWSDFDLPAIHQCMIRGLKSVRYPKPANGKTATIIYPFTFSSR